MFEPLGILQNSLLLTGGAVWYSTISILILQLFPFRSAQRALGECIRETAAYLALFHLFAVVFRHPTMLALVYALFMELFVANLPGSIKRLAINYYGRSLLYGLGTVDGLKTPRGFEVIPVAQAYWTLAGITAGCLIVAFLVFEWKEYRDVS